MASQSPQLFRYSQEVALSTFLPILREHLPHSNALYNRMKAPHNTPSRHCLFASTFAPPSDSGGGGVSLPEVYTIFFSDRSRHEETQIWIFNSLILKSSSSSQLSDPEQEILESHLLASILFIKNLEIPEAPGWPFGPLIKFGCTHETITKTLVKMYEPLEAIPYISRWNLWNISTKAVAAAARARRPLPTGFTVGRVPEEQLDIVLSTSSIKRQPSTMLLLPSVGLLNEDGKLVAWGYIGIEGSFSTLYVLPDYRGKGFASYVAVELLQRLERGDFADMGFDGESGWVHSDVYDGNKESEGVMKSLGGKIGWTTSYLQVDTDKF